MVCSRNWAVAIVTFFTLLVLTIAIIAAFARPSQRACLQGGQEESTETAPFAVPTPPTASDGQPFPWSDIRLPDSIIPISYDIFMHPNLTTFNFLGTISIELKILKQTDFIVLHSRGLNISQYEVMHFQNNQRIPVLKLLEYPQHEQVYFQLNRDLVTTKRYTLILTFHGVLSDLMAGFYRSSYTNSLGEKRSVQQYHKMSNLHVFHCGSKTFLNHTCLTPRKKF